MATSASYKVLHAIADRRSPAMQQAFISAVSKVRGGEIRRQIERHLRDGLIEEAARVAEDAFRAIARADLQHTIAEQTLRILHEAGTAEMEALSRAPAVKRARPQIAQGVAAPVMRFDIVNARAVRWASESAGELIRGIAEEQRGVIRAVLARAQQGQMTSRRVAVEIQESIGLRPDQEASVAHYRQQLAALAESAKLKTVGTLGGRTSSRGLTDAKIDAKVARYRDRLLRQRAQLIAHTEGINAATEGQLEAWRQARSRGQLPPTMMKTWIVTPDDRLCPRCAAMEDQTVAIEQPFVEPGTGRLVMGPTLHPRCRCSLGLVEPRRGRAA